MFNAEIKDILFNQLKFDSKDISFINREAELGELAPKVLDSKEIDIKYVKGILETIEKEVEEWKKININNVVYIRTLIFHPLTHKTYIELIKKVRKFPNKKIGAKYYIAKIAPMSSDDYNYHLDDDDDIDYTIKKENLIKLKSYEMFVEIFNYLVSNKAIFEYTTECVFEYSSGFKNADI